MAYRIKNITCTWLTIGTETVLPGKRCSVLELTGEIRRLERNGAVKIERTEEANTPAKKIKPAGANKNSLHKKYDTGDY